MAGGRVTLGLVGAGAIAQSYARAVNGSAAACIAAVCDVREVAADALAESLGCRAFADARQMFESELCEAILICTPPATHSEIALQAVDSGRHVLCEKPFGLIPGSARKMLETAERAGVLMTMSSKFRFVPAVIWARSILASGAIGDLILYENTFSSYVDMSGRWNARREVSGGGVLIDNGTHSVDLFRFLIGPIDRVHAVAGKSMQRLPVEDSAFLCTQTRDGVIGKIDLSWSLDTDRQDYVNVYGTLGTISIGWKESRFLHRGSSKPELFGTGYSKIDALGRQIENFCEALRGRESLLVTPTDILASVEVIESAYESLTTGRWVSTTIESKLNAQQIESAFDSLTED